MAKSKPVKLAKRTTKYDKAYLDAVSDHLLAWMNDPQNIWFKDFSLEYGISWKYLANELALKHEKLKAAIEVAQQIQESRLVKKGLTENRNPAFVIFALKNVAKWRDTIEDEETTADNLLPFVRGVLQTKGKVLNLESSDS